MFASRRGFLGRLGVGALGIGGLLLPGKARARWRSCGGVVYPPCAPPGVVCYPSPVICEPLMIIRPLGTTLGVFTISFPYANSTPSTPVTIYGNGNFYVWGGLNDGNAVDTLDLWSTDGTTAGSAVAKQSCSRLTDLGSGPFAFKCFAPVGSTFYLKFTYHTTPTSTGPLNPPTPWPGSYTTGGF